MALRRAKKGTPQLPEMTREQEAEFWDKHSVFEFEDDLEEVQLEVARPLNHVLAVRFDAKTIDALAAVGRSKGVGPSTLARMWVLERLAQEPPPRRAEARPRTPRRRISSGQTPAGA